MALCAAKDNDEIVDDLMTMFRQWSKDHFEFHTSPVLLFCESYGGKMGAAFAKSIAADQASGQLQINFQYVPFPIAHIRKSFVLVWALAQTMLDPPVDIMDCLRNPSRVTEDDRMSL